MNNDENQLAEKGVPANATSLPPDSDDRDNADEMAMPGDVPPAGESGKLSLMALGRAHKQAGLLRALRAGLGHTQAAKASGCSRASIYRWCEEDADFRARYIEARRVGMDRLEDVLQVAATRAAKDPKFIPALKFALVNNRPGKFADSRSQDTAIIKTDDLSKLNEDELRRLAEALDDDALPPTGGGLPPKQGDIRGHGAPSSDATPYAPPPLDDGRKATEALLSDVDPSSRGTAGVKVEGQEDTQTERGAGVGGAGGRAGDVTTGQAGDEGEGGGDPASTRPENQNGI